MGAFCNKRGLQTGILRDSKEHRNKIHLCICKRSRYFRYRSKRVSTKRSCRICTSERNRKRFLQHIFSCPQENRGHETSNKFKTPQQVSPKTAFQNGFPFYGSQSGETRRLGNQSGLKGRIFTCPNLQNTQEISEVLSKKRESSSVQGSTFRSNLSPKSFYKNCGSSSCPFKVKGHKTGCLSRRLVPSESGKKSINIRSRISTQSPCRTRIHNKLKKVHFGSITTDNILRGNVSLESGDRFANRGKNVKINSFIPGNDPSKSSNSQRFSSPSRDNVILLRNNSQCKITHETCSNTSVKILETSFSGSGVQSPNYCTSKKPSKMVVRSNQHKKGEIIETLGNPCHYDNGCLNISGLGRSHGDSDSTRNLEPIREKTPYQLLRNGSSDKNDKTLLIPIEGEKCINTLRQLNSGTIHQSSRGDQINDSMSKNLGIMEFGNRSSDSIESSPHCGQSKHSSGFIVEKQNKTHRMDTRKICSTKNIPKARVTKNRSVCINPQQTNSDFLHVVSSQSSLCSRRTVNSMAESVRVCISPNMPNTKNSTTHVPVQVSNSSNSTTLAKKTLVPRPVEITSRLPFKNSNRKQSFTPAGITDLSSKSRNIQSNCMASINRLFKKRGFSKDTRQLLSASWRAGTQKDYSGKFKKFCSWCNEREIDPYTASLTEVADFLTGLFTKGLQYRTIAGYRSMLSTVLPPIEKIPVGQHPYIIRLLKGVFNSRPPKIKLLPEWDLLKVLDMLQKSPFEPMKNSVLKYVTWKTIFLFAITTFRRCSDLQALRIGDGNISVHSTGVFFIREGLSKQDRPGHNGSKIFVPSFKDNKLLNPKRSLFYYLKMTDNFRNCDRSNSKLFLSVNSPHNPVSSQTISNWIVQTIQMAYNDKNKSVKAHSTRAIGPSWALFNGSSMKSIMEAADWSRESTFTKFYLRNLEPSVLS